MLIRAIILSSLFLTSIVSANTDTQWEYKVKIVDLLDEAYISKTLTKLGDSGWELVTCTPADGKINCIFKKPK